MVGEVFMKTLGIETTTRINSLALLENEKILDETSFQPEDASKEIFIHLDNFLKRNKISLPEIDLFVTSLGPGSWTGIRLGITLVKGFATALRKKVIGVYSSDTLAEAVEDSDSICILIKAEKEFIYRVFYSRGSIYRTRGLDESSPYRKKSSYTRIKKVSLQNLTEEIKVPTLFIGEALFTYEKRIKEKLGKLASFAREDLWRPKASFLAKVGYRQFQRKRNFNLKDLKPFYGETKYSEFFHHRPY